jgi:hypothetical protein
MSQIGPAERGRAHQGEGQPREDRRGGEGDAGEGRGRRARDEARGEGGPEPGEAVRPPDAEREAEGQQREEEDGIGEGNEGAFHDLPVGVRARIEGMGGGVGGEDGAGEDGAGEDGRCAAGHATPVRKAAPTAAMTTPAARTTQVPSFVSVRVPMAMPARWRRPVAITKPAA